MSLLFKIVIWLAYLTLLAELLFLHVPSVASSLRILTADAVTVSGYSERKRKLFRLPISIKILLFVLPIGVIYGVFAFPLIVTFAGPNPLDDYVFAPMSPWMEGGVVLLIAGRVITLAATLAIRTEYRLRGNSFLLHTAGVFNWSRNPGLVGMILFIIGGWLLVPSTTMAVGIGIYIAHMYLKIRLEEDFLLTRFGEQYSDYCRHTPRFLV